MAKPKIGVDIDEVLSASAEGFVRVSNEQWGMNLTLNDYSENWIEMWGVDLEEASRRSRVIYGSGVFSEHRHYPEARPVLEELSRHYQLVVLTSRRVSLEKVTEGWLDKYFPKVFSGIHFSGIWEQPVEDRHLISKADMCRELELDYLIDDQLKHAIGAAEVGVEAVLFGDYSWNQADELPDGIRRCKNWAEVGEYFAHVKAEAS